MVEVEGVRAPVREVGAPAPDRRGAGSPRPLVWWAEVVLVLGVYIAYDTTRGLHRGGLRTADRNGRRIYSWEHDLALSPEHWLNHSLHQLPVLEVFASYYYATLHFIVTPAVLIWMYRSHPGHYRHARTWLAWATVIALLGYWLFPVAPPRLLPGSGIHDILADVHQWGWWSAHSAAPQGLGGLVNEYAAMPSLHVGWALWVGWLVFRHARHRVVRGLGVAYPVATSLVVMGTGNHYLFDVLAGAGLIAVVGLVTALPMRHRRVRARVTSPPPMQGEEHATVQERTPDPRAARAGSARRVGSPGEIRAQRPSTAGARRHRDPDRVDGRVGARRTGRQPG